jgi:hypothetical protein
MTDTVLVRAEGASALPFLLSVPGGAAPEAGWPVLSFLHGYDEAAPAEIRTALTRHGPLNPDAHRFFASGFVVVAPQLPRAGDLWRRHADDVVEIVRRVQALHDGDASRTYLTGFSFGGNGVLDVALEERGIWAALWSVDPTRVPVDDPGLPVWLSAGALARHHRTGFISRLRLEPPGDGEGTDRVYVDEGEDHVGCAASAYRDGRIPRWLLARRLTPAGG